MTLPDAGPATTELLLIRHGETDWNREGRFQGQIDVPLNANGLAQAQRLAPRLAADKPDAFYSSDLRRALQTAAPLADAWALSPVALAGLREQGFGVFEGQSRDALQANEPALWQGWLIQQADFSPPGGESIRQFHARVVDTVGALAAAHAGQRVTVVTHGGVLDMLWRSMHRASLDGKHGCEMPNAGINRLRWADGALHIVQWADTAHLAGLDVLRP